MIKDVIEAIKIIPVLYINLGLIQEESFMKPNLIYRLCRRFNKELDYECQLYLDSRYKKIFNVGDKMVGQKWEKKA